MTEKQIEPILVETLEDKIEEIDDLTAINNSIDEKVKKLREKKETNKEKIQKIKDNMDDVLDEHDIDNVRTNFGTIYIRRSKSLLIEDESKIPSEYFKEVIKKENKLDKDLLKENLYYGEIIPGAKPKILETVVIKRED